MDNFYATLDPMETGSILFYTREKLDDITLKLMEQRLRKVPGVIAPWFHPERAHLLFIYFNPAKTRGPALVYKIRKFGLDAKIIG